MSQKKPRRSAPKHSAAKKKPQSSSDEPKSRKDDPGRQADGSSTRGFPSSAVRTWVSIWVCIHLTALLVSFTSVVEPSGLHARLSRLLYPYLRLTHFGADDRPVYLTHGDLTDRPHRILVSEDRLNDIDAIDQCDWRVVGMGQFESSETWPGMAVSDRVHRWLTTASTLAENDQPGVVADLLLPLVDRLPNVKAVRIVRYPTDLDDINAVEDSPYVARVVRDEDRVSLIQLSPERQSSKAIPSMGGDQRE